jgi:nucleoside-diphosphate-sugar epimerase
MRILIIGGTNLSGPFLVRHLLRLGHQVTIYHRGNHPENVPPQVEQIIAPRESGCADDRFHLRRFAAEFRSRKPDVAIHMMAFTRADAQRFVEVFKGFAGRVVVASSADVYLVMGIINRTESAPIVPTPIDENGPLRTKPSLHGAEFEKQHVEEVVLSEPKLPATVLRFGAIYGPGSHRLGEWMRPMIDHRPVIVIGKGEATFRFSHSYAEDIGWATTLAATNERAAGRIYNVGESDVPAQRRRLEHVARIANWSGRIVEVPEEQWPPAEFLPYHGQDWLLDTSRIRRELGFHEVSNYDDSLRATIDWQRAHPNPKFDPSSYAADDRLVECFEAPP